MSNTFFKDMMADYATTEGVNKYPISLGYTETGVEVIFDIKQLKHVLISGMSQSGKSTMVRKILPNLVKYADVSIYSTKDSDFIDYDDTAYNCSDIDKISAVVRRTVGEVEKRNARLRDNRRVHGVKHQCAEKPLVILIDEFQTFAELADKATNDALKRIIREGAGLNVFLYIIVQTPSKRVLSGELRDNIMTDIAFRQRDNYGSRMAIGSRIAEFLELRQCWVRNVDKLIKVTRLDSIDVKG